MWGKGPSFRRKKAPCGTQSSHAPCRSPARFVPRLRLAESATGRAHLWRPAPHPQESRFYAVRPSKGGAGGVRYFAVSHIIFLNAPHGAFKSGGAGGTAFCRGLGQTPNVPLVPLLGKVALLRGLPLERAAGRVQKRRCRRHCLLPGLGADPQRSPRSSSRKSRSLAWPPP